VANHPNDDRHWYKRYEEVFSCHGKYDLAPLPAYPLIYFVMIHAARRRFLRRAITPNL